MSLISPDRLGVAGTGLDGLGGPNQSNSTVEDK